MKHSEVLELLPWYVNATLDEQERQTVEAHVAGCSECAAELESLVAMRRMVVSAGDAGPVPSPFMLNRALEQIEEYERAKSHQEAAPQEATPRRAESGFWKKMVDWWQLTPAFTRFAIAAQLILVVSLGITVVYQGTHPSVIYVPLAGPSSDELGATLAVKFSQGATEQEIRQALTAVDGEIIAGPSALDLYTIRLKHVPRNRTEEIERARQTLQQNPRVITVLQSK
ncbi:MAG TPA: zf-HC2 domain-containing protein [Candidatus Angelobacter sp.]|jgi:hypothetical protein|nr:zf-HC2 domain-containing protein [Candidatus Angelobacter sp.]